MAETRHYYPPGMAAAPSPDSYACDGTLNGRPVTAARHAEMVRRYLRRALPSGAYATLAFASTDHGGRHSVVFPSPWRPGDHRVSLRLAETSERHGEVRLTTAGARRLVARICAGYRMRR